MNKGQFLRELRERLKHLPREDREDAIQYYEDYFLDAGISEEEDVLRVVAQPKQIAADIISESAKKQMNRGEKGVKGSMKTVWIVLLAILASPVAIPSVLVVGVLLFAVACVMFALLLTVVCLIFAVIISSVVSLWLAMRGALIGQCLISLGGLCLGIALLILVIALAIELFKRMATAMFRAKERRRRKGEFYE